jgi:hypothetical protein
MKKMPQRQQMRKSSSIVFARVAVDVLVATSNPTLEGISSSFRDTTSKIAKRFSDLSESHLEQMASA